ncbi:MAG: TOTE conflict system archaeo-eukaryotic primase domain-containing protein, partial [Ilumatobacteraceae bacterium]
MNQTVDTFVRLFRGRGDVYGHDEGRCVKSQLTDEHWRDHLTGVSGIGIYPAVPTRTEVICAWGCTDIDIEDHSQALLLQDTLAQAGVVSWVERSRSKGYHVWIFTTSPVSAESMRNMQLVAHQVAGMDPREVNPKQTDVSLTKYGNYVRLPYLGGMNDTPTRRVIIDRDGEPIPLIQFLGEATETANDPDLIDRIASMYQPPVHQHVVIDTGDPDLDLASSLREVNGLGYVIWRDG